MSKFVGRQIELDRLRGAMEKKTASFIVINGRRRIGKSRLVEEFSKNFDYYYVFSGLPPDEKTTMEDQLNEFSSQISKNFSSPKARYNDWSDAFWAVAEKIPKGKILLLFDEISWMGSRDVSFLGKIKNLWDLHLKKNDSLVFIICGSASSWIEKNILSNSGFVGRISFTLTLRELTLSECNKFWPSNISYESSFGQGRNAVNRIALSARAKGSRDRSDVADSIYEKIKILSITGGIPKYLEEIDPKKNAEQNIKNLCFTEGGILVEEFKQIFSDVFLRESELYKKILKVLSHGSKDITEIQKALNKNTQGRVLEYLDELSLAGFITRDYTWNVKTGKDSKLSRYRLHDNYFRFYLKYIDKNLTKIKRHSFSFKSLFLLPEWYGILGFQFENLILNNRKCIHQILGISSDEIISENPYFQKKTTQQQGCQIDYMIQTRFNTLYVCEIKFSKDPITSEVIKEVQEKINKLKNYKYFSCRPVLIHVNGVSKDVKESDFFSKIIDVESMF
ncbi:MAG: AAA family ATPase [Oligoflexia bacterium]|nr:AAA family ATPase [Oligoflexia bacterium]